MIEGIGEQIAGTVANLSEKIVAPIQQALEVSAERGAAEGRGARPTALLRAPPPSASTP